MLGCVVCCLVFGVLVFGGWCFGVWWLARVACRVLCDARGVCVRVCVVCVCLLVRLYVGGVVVFVVVLVGSL